MTQLIDAAYYTSPECLALDAGDSFREAFADFEEAKRYFTVDAKEQVADFFENVDMEAAIEAEAETFNSVLQWECEHLAQQHPLNEQEEILLELEAEALGSHHRALLETLLEECQKLKLFNHQDRMNWYEFHSMPSPGVLLLSKRCLSEIVTSLTEIT